MSWRVSKVTFGESKLANTFPRHIQLHIIHSQLISTNIGGDKKYNVKCEKATVKKTTMKKKDIRRTLLVNTKVAFIKSPFERHIGGSGSHAQH